MKKLYILTLVLLTTVVLGGVAATAQTADGETPAEEIVCDGEAGAAFGLCNAYCEAMDCELLFDGDPATAPSASENACNRVANNFSNITGRGFLPCVSCENLSDADHDICCIDNPDDASCGGDPPPEA